MRRRRRRRKTAELWLQYLNTFERCIEVWRWDGVLDMGRATRWA